MCPLPRLLTVPPLDAATAAELRRVIELDPRTVGVESGNWTTQLLADSLTTRTGVAVGLETVRVARHAAGSVGKRPTWTLDRRAAEQPEDVGKA
jgi:transposase